RTPCRLPSFPTRRSSDLGIITLGLGSAVMLANGGHETGAALALIATLVHLLNHAVFKSLLFLGAGAVQIGAGTRDLERLGGLVRDRKSTRLNSSHEWISY